MCWDHTWLALWWRVVQPDLGKERFPTSLPPCPFLMNVLTTPCRNRWSLKIIRCEQQDQLPGLGSQGERSGLKVKRGRAVKTVRDNPVGSAQEQAFSPWPLPWFQSHTLASDLETSSVGRVSPPDLTVVLVKVGTVFLTSLLCFSSRLRCGDQVLGRLILNENSYCTLCCFPVLSNGVHAAAAKSLQSCPTLCNPTDSSPPGSPVPGNLQARTLE